MRNLARNFNANDIVFGWATSNLLKRDLARQALNNAAVEIFFKTLGFYNTRRKHSAIGGTSPVKF